MYNKLLINAKCCDFVDVEIHKRKQYVKITCKQAAHHEKTHIFLHFLHHNHIFNNADKPLLCEMRLKRKILSSNLKKLIHPGTS